MAAASRLGFGELGASLFLRQFVGIGLAHLVLQLFQAAGQLLQLLQIRFDAKDVRIGKAFHLRKGQPVVPAQLLQTILFQILPRKRRG